MLPTPRPPSNPALDNLDIALQAVDHLIVFMRENFPAAHREVEPIINDLVKAQTAMENLQITIKHKRAI